MLNGHWTFDIHSANFHTKNIFGENVYLGDSHLLLHWDNLCDQHCLRSRWVNHPLRWRRYLNWSSCICRLQSSFWIHTLAASLMGRVIHHLWVSYLLRKSDDEHTDNTVEEKVRDWDPVLKKWYWYYFSTWIGTGFLTSRSLQSYVTTTQMYLALRAMVTNIQLIRRQLLLRIIFETGFINAYRVCAHAQRNVSLWQLYQLSFCK